MKRNFDIWLKMMKPSIAGYSYYIDFSKVIKNTESIKIGLCILNSLIGSRNIESEFEKLVMGKYAEDVLKCIPILLAVRRSEICVLDNSGDFIRYRFDSVCQSVEMYKTFMRETGLFNMLANHLTNNLVDYVMGVETGLDSNARKNRGGVAMEQLVEMYLIRAGLECNKSYFKQMFADKMPADWCLNFSSMLGGEKKCFDYVVHKNSMTYGIEVNFYSGGGSKLNEVARSYKLLAQRAKIIKNFQFVWVTDGLLGWRTARNNLHEVFDILDNLYCIAELESGVFDKLFNGV